METRQPLAPHLEIVLFAPYSTRLLAGDTRGPFGGAELQMAILAGHLPAHARTHVITDLPIEGESKSAYRSVSLFQRPQVRIGGIVNYLRFSWATFRVLNKFKQAVVVQRCSGISTLVVGLACRASGNYFVFNWAGECDIRGDHIVPRPVGGFLYRLGRRLAHGQIVQTIEQERWARGALISRIPNMIDNSVSWRATTGADVLWIGTIKSAFKQPELVLRLAAALPHRNFVMVGRFGEERNFNQSFRDSVERLPNVTLLGHVPREHLPDAYSRARCLVNTSTSEGFSNTFLEALASSVPIVSLSHNPDGILGPTGVVICANGDFTALCEGIEQMFDDAVWARFQSRCAPTRLPFTPEVVSQAFAAACSGVLSQSGARKE